MPIYRFSDQDELFPARRAVSPAGFRIRIDRLGFSILIAVAFSATAVLSQTNRPLSPRQQVAVPPADSSTRTLDNADVTQTDVQRRLTALESEQAVVRAKVETATVVLGVLATIMGVVFLIGTYGFFRTEARSAQAHSFALSSAKEAEKRATQAFEIAITGEKASQSRAIEVHEKFLTGSRETLDLVNATLNLAKEASERAARTIENRARLTISELDQDAQSLLASVPAQDDRALIANPGTRSTLRSLAHKISGFELNRFILPDTLQLTPPCVFIRAMDFHLNQQFDDALISWRHVAFSPDSTPHLRSLAWYWIGYEENNLNRFGDAEQSFANAAQQAAGITCSRKFELQRILLETRFFNKTRYQAESIVTPLEQLLKAIDQEAPSEERDARRAKIIVTLANVTYQSGRDFAAKGDTSAADRFARAAKSYEQVAKQDKWALFGLGEMLQLSGDETARIRALEIFREVRRLTSRFDVKNRGLRFLLGLLN